MSNATIDRGPEPASVISSVMIDEQIHQCHFCGTYVAFGFEYDFNAFDEDGNRKRHWLSDCRPDLVEHEVGALCTWPYISEMGEAWNLENNRPNCYAFQNRDSNEWTVAHQHFWEDGPC